MPLETMCELLARADEENYAVPAFNVTNDWQIQAIYEAARVANSPIIIQATEKGCKEFGSGDSGLGAKVLAGIVKEMSQSEKYRNIPVALHLDHGEAKEDGNIDSIIACIEAGFTSVMIDASKKDLEENQRITKKVVEAAREYGQKHGRYITVEAELGTVGGKGDKGKVSYTIPSDVSGFATETGIDALAVAWGTLHGANKSAGSPVLKPTIVDDCYKELKLVGKKVYLVSHGSSTVPEYLVARINKFGGQLKGTSGIDPDTVKQVISYGVRKVNIATDLGLAMTGALREYFVANPTEWDPRPYAEAARLAVYKVALQNMELFGSMNRVK